MSYNGFLLNISSKYILKEVLSYLEYYYLISLIKYNKNLQQKLDIKYDESIFKYEYYFKKIPKIVQHELYLTKNLPSEKEELFYVNPFLIKFKGIKINEYSLPINFKEMCLQDKIKLFKRVKMFFYYTLNNEQIELIELINEFRILKNIPELKYNKNELLCKYFREQKLISKNHLFINPIGEFKKKFEKKDELIIQILSLNFLNRIFIFENEEQEYIFFYSDCFQKFNLGMPYSLNINKKFHLINNINPELNLSNGLLKKNGYKILNSCLYDEGYQIFSLKDNELIGVLEGPSNTPYEDGYFIFKMLLTDNYPFQPPKFTFITEIFHPNISESGEVSIDILRDKWSPILQNFSIIIYSIQSLLNEPNIEDFLDENAAKLYKEDKVLYDEIIRELIYQCANYKKFQENLKKFNLKINILKKGNKIKKCK